jgi:membrane-associated phospholipid phosphatase
MPSILLILSYIADWIILIIFAAIGYAVGNITPNKRPFSLDDLNISFPYKGFDTVSLAVAFVVSLVAPAALIAVISFVLVPGSGSSESTRPARYKVWRSKLWEWRAGWLGLALSVVLAFFLTSGMKNPFGKPRPNLLSRCEPDIANLVKFVVSNATATNSSLVSAGICTNKDQSVIDEGFRSFPSGHSSAAASGLIYLSLWLAAKLGVGVPFLLGGTIDETENSIRARPSQTRPPTDLEEANDNTANYMRFNRGDLLTYSARKQDAAPPIYLLVITLIPLEAAVYICSSRWYDFQHHGFDIIFGFLIGTLSSILAFRYYHLPLCRGAGFAWAPRSEDKLLWPGIGSGGFSNRRRFYRLGEGGSENCETEGNQAGGQESLNCSRVRYHGDALGRSSRQCHVLLYRGCFVPKIFIIPHTPPWYSVCVLLYPGFMSCSSVIV